MITSNNLLSVKEEKSEKDGEKMLAKLLRQFHSYNILSQMCFVFSNLKMIPAFYSLTA